MSANSRSRQKRKLEPISIEELAGTTGMSGFCSFLTRDASVPVPILDQLESGAPEYSAPVLTAPEITAPEEAAVGVPAHESPALDSIPGLETSAPESSGVETSAIESDAADFRYRRRPRIREAHTVEDGHSLAEQAVYEAMFRAGKPYRDDSRILTIGLRTLAEVSRMAYSNCKANVRSLIAKLAIDELPGFSYTDGRTYVIHPKPEILRRRKAAGLTHVLRTRGVAFVDPLSGAPQITAPSSGAPESSAPLAIAEALRRHHPTADNAAASTIRERTLAAEILRNPGSHDEQREWALSILGV
jgi:hypothetical protein